VVGRAELLERVWGTSYTGFEHSVEQAVHELRRALKEPAWIETVRGIGYRFVPQPCAGAGAASPALDAGQAEG
jgi:DNA-binding response OmpR family regulator